jgi:hypothetical protein
MNIAAGWNVFFRKKKPHYPDCVKPRLTGFECLDDLTSTGSCAAHPPAGGLQGLSLHPKACSVLVIVLSLPRTGK